MTPERKIEILDGAIEWAKQQTIIGVYNWGMCRAIRNQVNSNNSLAPISGEVLLNKYCIKKKHRSKYRRRTPSVYWYNFTKEAAEFRIKEMTEARDKIKESLKK